MIDFVMPSLGADMESGVLVEWRVKPGDRVSRGDIVAEIETQKGLIEIEIFEEGVIEELLVPASRDEIAVGTVLAHISGEAEAEIEVAAPVAAAAQASPLPLPVPVPRQPTSSAAQAHRVNGKRVRISPLARNMAEELGIDLDQIKGTGPGGAISKADVERAAEALKAEEAKLKSAPPLEPVKPKKTLETDTLKLGIRQAIAAAMARSNREIPHYYLEMPIDLTSALQWLEAENQKRSIKDRLLIAVVLLKAVARALEDVPELNGYWVDDHLEIQEGIHIGFAIALRKVGLIAPAIHNVDLKSMDELMEALRDLITRTRTGGLRSSEMTDATITVTSLGDLGVKTVYGIIYPPQVGLVGLGTIIETPVAENGMLGIRPVMTATIAGDHRATDGRTGALFLDALNRHLQEVEKL
jgi:pyruvate dehydrogenase E2 component (dihydrolipoamide acetyltransferase)